MFVWPTDPLQPHFAADAVRLRQLTPSFPTSLLLKVTNQQWKWVAPCCSHRQYMQTYPCASFPLFFSTWAWIGRLNTCRGVHIPSSQSSLRSHCDQPWINPRTVSPLFPLLFWIWIQKCSGSQRERERPVYETPLTDTVLLMEFIVWYIVWCI